LPENTKKSTCLLISEVNDEPQGQLLTNTKTNLPAFLSYPSCSKRTEANCQVILKIAELNREYFLRYQAPEIYCMSVSKEAFSVTVER
jgi:hypothetical protein